MAKDAHVAHMWRVPSDPRTHPKYVIPPGAAAANRMRAAVAWFGEYAEKLKQFPELRASEKAADGSPWYGDISNILSVRSDLKCKSYSWFMHRFKHVYEDAGLVPREIFSLQVGGTGASAGKCLTYNGAAGTSQDGRGTATLEACDSRNDRQRWHGANRDSSKAERPCCSGLRAWNTDQCIARAMSGQVETFVCDVDGANPEMLWELTSDGLVQHKVGSMGGAYCLEVNADGDDGLKVESCKGASGLWIKENAEQPIETRLYAQAASQGYGWFG